MSEDDCLELPPSFQYHIIDGHVPSIYYWFWPISFVAWTLSVILIVPAIHKIRTHGVGVRNSNEDILLPSSYRFILLIVAFPLVLCTCKFVILISPLTVYAMEFICHGYEGICLYCFSRLLIMFLGSHKIAVETLENVEPIKFWAVLPFGCCFRPCCKPQKFTRRDFRLMYSMIIQYTILAPCLSFLELVGGIQNDQAYLRAVNYLSFLSSFTCIYALFALLKVSAPILHTYRAHGKFFTIKGAVFCVIIPEIIIQYTNIKEHGHYNAEVMHQAYSAFVTIVLISPLSFGFTKFFGIKDCEAARIIPIEKKETILMESFSKSQPLITNNVVSPTPKSKEEL